MYKLHNQKHKYTGVRRKDSVLDVVFVRGNGIKQHRSAVKICNEHFENQRN